ncbi:MAG: PDZ domain-containing protein, partial [Caldilineae bacterium]
VVALAGCAPAPAFNAAPAAPLQPAQRAEAAAPVAIQTLDQEALADLYDRVIPSVVNIQVTLSSPAVDLTPQFPFGFPNIPQVPQRAEGSGFIYDDQGHVVTNNHVVEGASEVIVTFYNGLWSEAEIVATDPQSDLAVLQVQAPEGMTLTPLPLAEPDTLRPGYGVIAIGNPFGLESTMTTGIVSALGRSFPVGEGQGGRYTLPDVIQTDAAINPGNSGGPLLNLKGEVVGVNFAIESPVRGSSGVGFAIPVSIVRRVVPALIAEGHYAYPYLGISGQSITPELARALDLPENVLGAYVAEVPAGGPAAKAGVRGGDKVIRQGNVELRAGGDIIVGIDDEPVRSFDDLVSYLVRKTEPGQKVRLTILRDGKTVELDVTLGERPQASTTAQEGPITARRAIEIAKEAVQKQELLSGRISEVIVTQDVRDGVPVWVVELGDGKQTARVVIDARTGEVLEISLEM